MTVIPWPPPVADMSHAYLGEDHYAANGEVQAQPENKITGIASPSSAEWVAIWNEALGLHSFGQAAGLTFPIGAALSGYSPAMVNTNSYATEQTTELIFFEQPQQSSDTNVYGSLYATQNVMDGGLRASDVTLLWSAEHGYFATVTTDPRTKPWTMVAFKRDHTLVGSNAFWVRRQDESAWAPLLPSANYGPVSLPSSAQCGVSGLSNVFMLFRWDRLLTDAEIESVYAWAQSFLPVQIAPVERASFERISTLAFSSTWDAAYGTADVFCTNTGGRPEHSYTARPPGFVEMHAYDASVTEPVDYTWVLTWADGVETVGPLTQAVPVVLSTISATEVTDRQATFTNSSPAVYDLLVFKDGQLAGIWPAGVSTYTVAGLEALVPYRFDFQQADAGDGTIPTDVAWLDIVTIEPQTRAVVARLTTFAYSAEWDMADGTADIVCTDGRVFPAVSSPAFELAPITQDVSDFGYTLTWADALVETFTWPRATPVDLDVLPIIVSHSQATFTIGAPIAYSVEVYRNGVHHATLPPGASEYVDAPLEADTAYAYRFEQTFVSSDTPPTGYGEASIVTRAISAPASEYWVSQGGVWVKASSALGSFKGEWIPLTGTDVRD